MRGKDEGVGKQEVFIGFRFWGVQRFTLGYCSGVEKTALLGQAQSPFPVCLYYNHVGRCSCCCHLLLVLMVRAMMARKLLYLAVDGTVQRNDSYIDTLG